MALNSQEFSPQDYAVRTGELVAQYDREWQLAHNRGENVNQAVCDFLAVVVLHVDALAQNGELPEAVTTMLFGLLSVDIAKADYKEFQSLYVRANYLLCMLLISLVENNTAPQLAEHLDVCARYAILLFTSAYRAYLEKGTPIVDQGLDDLYRQFEASGILTAMPPLHGEAPDAEGRRGEILVDILTRLRACGLATI